MFLRLGHDVLDADRAQKVRLMALLAPGRGKTKKAYVWVQRTINYVTRRAVLYDSTLSRAGEHPCRVLGAFNGTLVTDDFSGHHTLHRQGITAAFCMAHACRKLLEVFELNHCEIAGQAVALIANPYENQREVKDLGNEDRLLARQQRSKPVADALHTWLTTQRLVLAMADATARAID